LEDGIGNHIDANKASFEIKKKLSHWAFKKKLSLEFKLSLCYCSISDWINLYGVNGIYKVGQEANPLSLKNFSIKLTQNHDWLSAMKIIWRKMSLDIFES